MVWLGQRKTMLVTLPVVMITWICLAFASSVTMLLALRLLQGVLVGALIGPAVSYIVEVSHHSIRGSMTGILDIVRQLGYVLVFSVGSCGLSWRYTAIICGLSTSIVPFVALLFYPDSPRWLVIHNKVDQAYKAIRFFHGDQYDVQVQFDLIHSNISKNNHGQNTRSQLHRLFGKQMRKHSISLVFLMVMLQCTGFHAIISYTTQIFQDSHVGLDMYTSAILSSIGMLVGAIFFTALVDHVGRLQLFIWPMFGSCVSLVCVGIFFLCQSYNYDMVNYSFVPATTITINSSMMVISLSSILLLRNEVFPTEVRAVGIGVTYAVYYAGAFASCQLHPFMVNNLGYWATFTVYAVFAVLCVILVALTIPETKGRSIDDNTNTEQHSGLDDYALDIAAASNLMEKRSVNNSKQKSYRMP